ncbi:MAG: cbb3-type cytochrome oxidase assembly protein CcoS [Arcobacteraceae bacterium]|jgi:cbb3-type cytochrome oxidase maturation protein|nr:cbb3-type cytochrome oxidase assembly protein CcoS [Arcobacteraceae bacterium]MDY0365205.1 cbb3-type cytochrome oxidase assembly protein CcoS [Arcobacteraceae bacterium]
MEISGTLFMMLIVSLVVGFSILAFFLWGVKSGQFDDSKRMMDGLLFDSEDDLNDAYQKELKKKQALEKKEVKK